MIIPAMAAASMLFPDMIKLFDESVQEPPGFFVVFECVGFVRAAAEVLEHGQT